MSSFPGLGPGQRIRAAQGPHVIAVQGQPHGIIAQGRLLFTAWVDAMVGPPAPVGLGDGLQLPVHGAHARPHVQAHPGRPEYLTLPHARQEPPPPDGTLLHGHAGGRVEHGPQLGHAERPPALALVLAAGGPHRTTGFEGTRRSAQAACMIWLRQVRIYRLRLMPAGPLTLPFWS